MLSESKSGVPKVRNHPSTTAAEEVTLVSTVPPPCVSPPWPKLASSGGWGQTRGSQVSRVPM